MLFRQSDDTAWSTFEAEVLCFVTVHRVHWRNVVLHEVSHYSPQYAQMPSG